MIPIKNRKKTLEVTVEEMPESEEDLMERLNEQFLSNLVTTNEWRKKWGLTLSAI